MDLSDAINILEKADVSDLRVYSRDLRDIVARLGEPIPDLFVLGKHIVSVETTGEDNLDKLLENGGSGNYSIDVERLVTLVNGWLITIKIDGSVELFNTNNSTERDWMHCNVDISLCTPTDVFTEFSDITEALYSIVEKSGPHVFMHIFDDLRDLVNDCISKATVDEIETVFSEDREELEDYVNYHIGPLE